jgi:hypothetical protein
LEARKADAKVDTDLTDAAASAMNATACVEKCNSKSCEAFMFAFALDLVS